MDIDKINDWPISRRINFRKTFLFCSCLLSYFSEQSTLVVLLQDFSRLGGSNTKEGKIWSSLELYFHVSVVWQLSWACNSICPYRSGRYCFVARGHCFCCLFFVLSCLAYSTIWIKERWKARWCGGGGKISRSPLCPSSPLPPTSPSVVTCWSQGPFAC